MDGSGGLAAAEQSGEPVKRRVELRRHREYREKDQGRENEEHSRIGHLLQRVVFALLGRLPAQAKIVEQNREKLGAILRSQEKLAHVAPGEVVKEVEQAVQGKEPGKEKVPAPSPRK